MRKLSLVGAMFAAVAAAWGNARAVPDPTKTIVTGVYWLPYPVSNPAQYYSYQRIADAGFDVMITIQGIPQSPPPANARDLNSQSAMIEKAADTNPPLWVMVERGGPKLSSCGIVEDTTASYAEVDSLMSELMNATSLENVYGWATWHEAASASWKMQKSDSLELFVRQAAANLSGEQTWTTFVGWFDLFSYSAIDEMLGYLDDNVQYYPNGYNRRPVFGVEAYRFRNRPGCDGIPVMSLNLCLDDIRDVVLNHPHAYPWWSIVTITAYGTHCAHPNHRPPSPDALRQDVFTHLAWGAKGIFYYTYMHGGGKWGDSTFASEHWQGVYNASSPYYTSVDPTDSFNEVYDWITDINAQIHALQDILGPAVTKRPVVGTPHYYCDPDWGWNCDEWALRADTLAQASAFVTSLTISPEEDGVNALATPMTVSNRDAQHTYYALVVNQWETDAKWNEAGGPIDITLTIDPDSLYGTGDYLIAEDTLNARWLIADDFVITDQLAKGEAKMYRLWRWNGGNLTIPSGIVATCLTSVNLVGTITVQNGATLSLEEGATINIEQDYGSYCISVNGGGTLKGAGKSVSTIEGRVEVTGNSATVKDLRIHWPDEYGMGYGAIDMSGSMTSTQVLNCQISAHPNDNGTDGIRLINTGSGPTIRGNDFDSVYAAVYAYNGSDPTFWKVYGDYCGDASSVNNALNSMCLYGLYAYLNSEFSAGYDDPGWVGANNFNRPNNGASSGGHVYAYNTGWQWCHFNYWKDGPDVHGNSSVSTSHQCGQFQRPAQEATGEPRPILAAIDSAAAPARTGDVAGALRNLSNLALSQSTAFDALLVLDRITEITSVGPAKAAVEAVRSDATNDAVRQATAWILARLRHWEADPEGAAQWYATVRTYDADDTLAIESKFVEAELLVNLPGQRDAALALYTEFLAQAAQDNPNRRIAAGRLRAIGLSSKATSAR